jgi:sulfate adenylyltransferase subunit 1 (EFTu-like GTPase family)
VRARVESLAWRWDVDTQTREVHPATLEANGIGRAALALGRRSRTDDYRAIRRPARSC